MAARKKARAGHLVVMAVAACALGQMGRPALAADVVWVGLSSTAWNDAANWSTGEVPGPADIVYLHSGTPFAPTNMNIPAAVLSRVIYVGTTDLNVTGGDLTLTRLATRHGRTVTYTTGNPQITVIAGSGTAGLQVGMGFHPGADGIPAGAVITSIDSATKFTISANPTSSATSQGRSFDAVANLTWGGNIIATASDTWSVAAGRTMSVTGNVSGAGGVANGNIDGTLELRGTNTYLGRTYANTGTIRFYGAQSVAPLSIFGRGSGAGNLRYSSQTGSGDFAYKVPNVIESGQGAATMQVDGGGRVEFTGNWVNNGTGVRGFNLLTGGTGTSIYDLMNTVQTSGQLSVQPETLVRLHNPMGAAYAGNSDITSSTDRSTIDGTLDLMGNPFDRKIGMNNRGGALTAGNLVNSNLATPSLVSSAFSNLGTNGGSKDFGGPGTMILTGALRLAASASDTGVQKVGPGGVILRTTSLVESTAGSNNPNSVLNGTLVLDHSANNAQKLSDDALQMQNGRLVLIGNGTAASNLTVGGVSITGASDRGYAEIDVRSGASATASLTFGAITSMGDLELMDFSVSNGGGGVPVLNTSHAAGALAATITFNKNQWAQVSGGQVLGLAPEVAANDAASFAGTGYTRNLDVSGSFTTDAIAQARTLRFTEAAGNTLTLGAALRLNFDNGGGGLGSGILKTAGSGAVTIDGTSSIELGANTALAIHQHSSEPLTISARITGVSGTELTKVGVGELVLSNTTNSWGSNSTTGTALGLYEGTVTISAIANTGVNSSIGQNGIIAIGSKNTVNLTTGVTTQTPARLRYVGTGHATNRTLLLNGVSEIQANGTGLLDFTSTGDVVTNAANTGAWNDLILSGSGDGRIAGRIKLDHGNLVKTESGTWTLSSTSSVTTFGQVLVSGGTLVNDGAIGLHARVVVDGGTLSGIGQISGPLSITSTGSLSPGNSAGTMLVGSVAIDGTLVAEILGAVAGTEYDQLQVTGGVALGNASNLDLSVGYTPADGAQYVLISNDAADPIVGMFSKVNGAAVSGNTFAAGGYQWTLNYSGGDGNDLIATVAVPEPGTVSIVAGVAMGLLAQRRRSQKRA